MKNNKIEPKDKIQLQLEEHERETNKIETFEKLHNKKTSDMSRRELLATGIIPFAASMAAPSFLGMLAKTTEAKAADELMCKIVSSAPLCPMLNISCAGGAGLSANVIPLAKDGSFLNSYSKLGMGKIPNYTYEFKPDTQGRQAVFYRDSQLLAGIRAMASPQTLKETHFISVCVRAQDDSTGNRQSIDGLVMAAGRNGDFIANAGTSNSLTGSANMAAITPPKSALRIGSVDDVRNALAFTGTLATLTPRQRENMIRTVSSLSNHQMAQYLNQSGGTTLARYLGCANQENLELVSNENAVIVDPRQHPDMAERAAISTLYTIAANTANNNQAVVSATSMYVAMTGVAATSGITIGGCDYHNGTRTAGDARDLQIGTEIGRAIQMASILKKKIFLMVTTDGGVTGPETDLAGGIWSTDNGQGGIAYMLAYDPEQKSKATTTQLGYYNQAQAAADDFVWGTNTEKAAAAILANYLNYNNQAGLIETVIPRVFDPAQLEKILVLFNS